MTEEERLNERQILKLMGVVALVITLVILAKNSHIDIGQYLPKDYNPGAHSRTPHSLHTEARRSGKIPILDKTKRLAGDCISPAGNGGFNNRV